MTRVARIDRFVARLDFVESAVAPRPGYAPARYTPEGYLEVDALIARDGLLEYSDGEDTWKEYRPRAELEAAAATWGSQPITDDHPAAMVDSSTWEKVARGIHMRTPSVEVHDGVTYLRAPIRITSASLLKKITDGLRELSIGFTSEVIPAVDGVAPDGTRCDAIQTQLLGNHTAVVEQGRAGPTCRILMDGARWSVPVRGNRMAQKNGAAAGRKDNIGMGVEQVPYKMPDGSEVMLPTQIVAALERLAALEAAQTQPMAEGVRTNVQQPPTAPAAPAAAPGPAMPGAPAPVAAMPQQPPRPDAAGPQATEPNPEDEEKKMTDKIDSVTKRFDRRRRLDRLALSVGIPADKLDGACTDAENDVVARAIVASRMPWMAENDGLKEVKGDALDLLVTAAAKQPTAKSAPRTDANPWAQPAPVQGRTDAGDELAAKFLQRSGVSA